MANKAKKKKNNKNIIIGCSIAAIVVIVAIVIGIVLATRGSGLNDDYFVSDGTKYVITVDSSEMTLDDEEQEYAPIKTHLVYTYSGDEITGLKSYYEYADATAAQKALERLKEVAGDEMEDITVDGKYVIATAKADQYENITASDVKQQIEFMEMLKNMDANSDDTSDDADDTIETDDADATNEDNE